jgi:hypothetical protein
LDESWTTLDPPLPAADFFGLHPMATAGVLVGVERGPGDRVEYLIGDVNEDGGLCDCCGLHTATVLGYKVVWAP